MSKTMTRTSQDAFLLISDLWRALRCCQQDETFCAGLTFGQFRILDAVAGRGRLKLSDLHGLLAVDKSTTTRLIRPLVQRKLIAQERSHADSRAVELKLTGQGKMIHHQVQECFEKFSEAVQANIPAKERGRVYSGTRLFAQALQQACDGPSSRRAKQTERKFCHGRSDNRNAETTS